MINNNQITTYKNKGYLVLKNFFLKKKIASLREKVLDISREKKNNKHLHYEIVKSKRVVRRIEKIYDKPYIKKSLNDKKLNEIISKLLGGRSVLFKDKVNFKYPGGEGFLPHVDGHFLWRDKKNITKKGWKHYSKNFLNLVIPLEKSNKKNGCLYLADLNQSKKILGNGWTEIRSNLMPRTPLIRKNLLNKIKFRPINLNTGDILLFDWKVCHFSKKNLSLNSRIIFYLTYAVKDSRNKNIRKNYYLDKIRSKSPLKHKMAQF